MSTLKSAAHAKIINSHPKTQKAFKKTPSRSKMINTFSQKSKIDIVWQRLLSGASREVLIFAGDVSWIDRDSSLIREQTGKGVNLQVLCRRPRHNEILKSNVRELLEAGGQVKYYEEAESPVVRGMIIDSDNIEASTALIVSKVAKTSVKRKYGVPGTENIYKYEGIRYMPPHDTGQIKILRQLFYLVWQRALTGFVLEPRQLTFHEIVNYLKTVPHYVALTTDDVRLETVDIQSLWACTSHVKDYKFPDIISMLDAYETQQIAPFSACEGHSHLRKSLLLPPILEKHNDRLVVVDGMHRLFCRLAFKQKADAVCLVVSSKLDLPSLPVPLVTVRVWPTKLARNLTFMNFRPELFRSIDILDRALQN